MSHRRGQCGFIMLPVVIALTLLATIAYLLTRDAGMNASMAAGGFEAASARYVAEAGLSRINYQAQNANCVNYPVLSNVAFGAGEFSASATPASGSPVTLTATATTAGGAALSLTRTNVPVYRTTPYTFTFQPAITMADTYIKDGGNALKNYGTDDKLKVDSGGTRPLLRFDVSSIPSTAIIESAQLMLYKQSGGAGPTGSTITAYPLTRAWVEGTLNGGVPANGATWNTSNGLTPWTTPGGDYDASAGAVTASTAANSVWVSWNVAQIVANWVSGTSPNRGVILLASAGVPNQDYAAGIDPTRANTPKLIVTFRARCDWTAPPASTTLTPASDSYLDKNNLLTNYGSATSITLADQVDLRGLFQFDTSAVVPGTLINDAKLRLYVTGLGPRSGNTMNLEVRRVDSAWTETAVSWTIRSGVLLWVPAGGDFSGSNAATLAVPASFTGGWIEFDITTLAQGWIDGVVSNRGVIVLEKAADRFFVASKEAGGATAPQLVITY